jgi:hypothetical protein
MQTTKSHQVNADKIIEINLKLLFALVAYKADTLLPQQTYQRRKAKKKLTRLTTLLLTVFLGPE